MAKVYIIDEVQKARLHLLKSTGRAESSFSWAEGFPGRNKLTRNTIVSHCCFLESRKAITGIKVILQSSLSGLNAIILL